MSDTTPATRVHLACSQKGGVGKTTLTVNMAAHVGQSIVGKPNSPTHIPGQQSPVLAVSIDPQGSLMWWGDRIKQRGGTPPFDVMQISDPAQLHDLRNMGYQHVFLDSAGSFDREELLRVALDLADDCVVPCPPEGLALDPTARTAAAIMSRGVPFRIVINRWQASLSDVELRQIVDYVNAQGWPLARTVVRALKIHTRAALEGLTVIDYPGSRLSGEAKSDIADLCSELGYGGAI